MQHLFGLSDIRHVYHLRNLAAVQRWCQHPSFPAPCASYAPSQRPLFDPEEIAAWVAKHRPEYVANATGEVR